MIETTAGSLLDTILGLWASDGTLLRVDKNSGLGFASRIEYTATNAAWYPNARFYAKHPR